MPLTAGDKLGAYEITSLSGAGGQGEVYKATDTRLGRTVALKVLPSHLAGNPLLKERFEREARTADSLNHPHICTLYDIGKQDTDRGSVDFMVMEFIDGETLRERLATGPLPLQEALGLGMQAADALDKAHRAGVVHRDVKPGNMMLSELGIKILDFGLAKPLPGASPTAGVDLSALSTKQKPLTEDGTIVGTFQYMAPEQLEGKEADARTDIFAFGAVLYEMLTGKRAFEGKSQASLIGAIMNSEPAPLSELQPMTPPALERTVKRCLEKAADDRWQTARDLHEELKWIAEGGSEVCVSDPVVATPPSLWKRALTVGLAVLLGAVVTGIAVWSLMRSGPAAPVPLTRFGITLPADQRLTNTGRHAVALSPDGTHLVYVANSQLYLRSMDQMEATPIRGTEGTGNDAGRSLFLSPDGQWVGFWAGGKLKKVSISGGAPVTLCDGGNPYGASWGPEDKIVFGRGPGGILRVSGQGGTPEVLVKMDASEEESGHGPQILPDGKTLLFTLAVGENWDEAQILVQSLDTGERKVLIEGGSDARYVPTGHLVYALGETVFSVTFDLERLEVTSGPVPIVEGVRRASYTGAAHFSFSERFSGLRA